MIFGNKVAYSHPYLILFISILLPAKNLSRPMHVPRFNCIKQASTFSVIDLPLMLSHSLSHTQTHIYWFCELIFLKEFGWIKRWSRFRRTAIFKNYSWHLLDFSLLICNLMSLTLMIQIRENILTSNSYPFCKDTVKLPFVNLIPSN